MRGHKGDLATLRTQNRHVLLNHLRRHGPASRARLADVTGLSPATVTFVSAELLNEGLIIEDNDADPSASRRAAAGRRPTPLAINYGAWYAIGIKVRDGELRAVLTDLGTTVLAHGRRPLEHHVPATVTREIVRLVEHLLTLHGIDRSRLIGVGIGLPGIVDAGAGISVHSPELGWYDEPVRRPLEALLRVPVRVDNVVNTFAAAELLFGHGKRSSNFIAITIGRGIGASLVIDGAIHRGRRGGAGEFGHVLSELGGHACACGRRGCLEAYASERALLARFNEAEHADLRDISQLIALANAQHTAALHLIHDAGERTGRALGDFITLLAPDLIVIGGEGVRLGDAFFSPLREALRERAYPGHLDDVTLHIDAWDDAAWARGAASLVVHHTFDRAAVDALEPRTAHP